MLTIMKTEDWENCPPLSFYLTPLQKAIRTVRDELLKMNKEGELRCRYIIELNTELMAKTIEMVKKDGIA